MRTPFLLIALGALAPACGGGGGGGGGGGTLPAFRVLSTNPEDGDVNVGADASVVVTFSQPVDMGTVDQDDAIRVGKVDGSGEAFGVVSAVPGSLDRVLEFVPTGALESATTYTVLLSPRLRSTSGSSLGGDTDFSFRTGSDVTLPTNADRRATANLLDTGRRHHAATLLANGNVLITGGFIQGDVVTNRAEIFFPGSETFVSLANRMVQGRAGHTATLLTDGRVLIAGGYYNPSIGSLAATDTAEIFDPATSTFTATGSLLTERFDHAALRLPDGRVLVTGGSRLLGAVFEDFDDAEVFSNGTWTAWPSLMTHSRSTHGMVDLGDGRWFLAGGSETDLRGDLFSLTTGLFTPVAQASEDYARFGAAMTTFADGDAAVVGGEAVGTVLHFDRATSRLANTGSGTDRPRAYATATRIGPTKVLVVGGFDWSDNNLILGTADLVVQGGIAGSQTFGTPMTFPAGLADHTATLLVDGRVLLCGGALAPTSGPQSKAGYIFTP